MLKAVIIDDEEMGREMLVHLLTEYCPQVEVVGVCDAIAPGIEMLKASQPDVLFLDIKMPQGTGFDLLDRMAETDFEVIFTTAHADYAIKAFKVDAIDYLLKPIDPEELKAAVGKVEKLAKTSDQHGELKELLLKMNKKANVDQIALPTSEGLSFIKTDHVIRCEADGAYTKAILEDGKELLFSKNLKELENLLSDKGFYRIHHSHLINLKHVRHFMKSGGGQVIMSDKSVVDISRRKREAFIQLFRGN